jgi:magnesium-transporting ATPase (P-type)
LPCEISAVRDGVETRVAAADLVPGDVIRLDEGEQVPADGQLLAAQGLRVDQSAQTRFRPVRRRSRRTSSWWRADRARPSHPSGGRIASPDAIRPSACRTDRQSVFSVGLTENRMVFVGVAAEVAILLGLILLPPLRHVFGLAPLSFSEWGILLLFAPTILLVDEVRKGLLRRLR